MKKMKESNRKDLHPYFLFYKGTLEKHLTDLKVVNKDIPYLFVIDQNGNILYDTEGFLNEKKMERIEEVLDARLD